MTKVGLRYIGRRGVHEKGEANILFVLGELKKLQPNAVYDHLTLVGHSNRGDIAVFCAKHHPELVSKVITLDNSRVPFVLNDKMKILSFRSTDRISEPIAAFCRPPSGPKQTLSISSIQDFNTRI